MASLDALRTQGWSYWAGYSHDYRSYVARAWKPREKPTRVRSPGGRDITLVMFSVSAAGDTLEDAATRCAERVRNENDASGCWWDGLPESRVKGYAV